MGKSGTKADGLMNSRWRGRWLEWERMTGNRNFKTTSHELLFITH